MAAFYKTVLQGTAFGQTINNVLYYQRLGTNDAPFDPVVMGDLADTIEDDVLPALSAGIVAGLTWTGIIVTTINEDQETTSPYAVQIDPSGTGGVPEGPDSPAMCWIVGFRVVPAEGAPGILAPKRSYIALGPAPSSQVDPNGLITLPAPERQAIEAAVSSVLEGTLGAYQPMRVGRAGTGGTARYGRVLDGLFRPFVSFRRSRLVRPSGV